MLNSVDVDRSGRFGIYSRKDVYIYNLDRWAQGIDDGSEFIKVNKGRILGLNKSSESSSNLNSIFMDGYDNFGSMYSEIVKFGTHPRLYNSFINIQGNSILYGTLESIGLDCISSQMMNISSFDWSPHFSTGTFVTSCEDALIRVLDIRSKNQDLSLMSFYNTKSIKWNLLNSYLLGALHENGEFLSIYDLRLPKMIGIIPRNSWISDISNRREEKRGDKGIIDFSWLPLSSDKILICEMDLLCVINVPKVMEGSKIFNGGILDCDSNLRVGNGLQYISLKNSNVSPDFEVLNFSSSSVDENEDLGEDEVSTLKFQEQAKAEIGKINQDLSWENGTCIKVNAYDFLPGTNNLIINDKSGRFYYSEIKDNDDFGLRRLKMRYNGPVKRIFLSENNELTLFGGLKGHNHSKSSYFEKEDELMHYNFYVTSLASITNENTTSKDEEAKISNLTIQTFFTNWFYRDLNMIHEKVKQNQQMANNLISISIESNDRIIAKLSRHPTLRGKFVMEDNTNFNLVSDSFEFTIILTSSQEKNTIEATYYITNNTILRIKEIYSNLINKISETNINSCGQIFKILHNYEHTSLNNSHAKEENCMQNIIPVRVYLDNIILNCKERERLCKFFDIELDKELLTSLFSELLTVNNNQVIKQLVDWVWIISNLPESLFGLLTQNDGFKKEQQLELISSTRKHLYGLGFEQQAILGENRNKKTKVSYTFHTLDKLIISQGSYLIFMKVNDEHNLNKAARYEKILLEINEILRKVEYISEEKFLYGDYFKYTYILLNWLTTVLYKQSRRHCVKDLQNFCTDPTKNIKNSNLSMMLCPTVVHSYFKKKSYINASRAQLQFDQGNDFFPTLRYKFNAVCSSLSDFEQIDQIKLINLLKKLYLEIKNNYDARILVVAIHKFSNHLKRTENGCQSKHSLRPGLRIQSEVTGIMEGPRTKGFGPNFASESGPVPGIPGERRIPNIGPVSISSVSDSASDLALSSRSGSIRISNPVSEGCCVCLEPVFGLYTRCLRCKHGGHIRHIRNWFEDRTKCPMVECQCKCVPEEYK
ncbi:WD40 repeat and RING finger domain-containing protein [Cryptosporidium ubiquitum]|uniref:WD40 repeat and RING finger domain-containing protein n=1 Tax=Cryptosporidium ubiquitum TaxID=857276 RepID=A0A1J4MIW6_9CRYT|nr:WD40 repeat and RING finger domain-containing protein [Cryptosporidium ubiquitum]OII72797.1 WD40 repeat and RING finger domain-containing protein [Cryptosporidium ubiquitum]